MRLVVRVSRSAHPARPEQRPFPSKVPSNTEETGRSSAGFPRRGGGAPPRRRTMSWEDLRRDPRFEVAVELLNGSELDDALEAFGALQEEAMTSKGELSTEAGLCYFYIGTTLLCKAEDNSTLFGDAVNSAAKEEARRMTEDAFQGIAAGDANDEAEEPEEDEDDEEDDEEEDEEIDDEELEAADEGGEAAAGEGQGESKDGADTAAAEQAKEQMLEDVEIAWQNLEVARVIFEKEESGAARVMLGRVHEKLGSLQKMNADYSNAIADFEKAIALIGAHAAAEDLPSRRKLALIHFEVGECVQFAAADGEEKGKAISAETARRAVECYGACKAELQSCIQISTDEATKADLGEVLLELEETIESLTGSEMDLLQKERDQAPVTTIGFGAPAAFDASAFGTSAFAKKEDATDVKENDPPPAVPVTTLTVKRKAPPADDTEAKKPKAEA